MAVGEMKAKTGGLLVLVFAALATAGYYGFDNYNNSQVPALKNKIELLKTENAEIQEQCNIQSAEYEAKITQQQQVITSQAQSVEKVAEVFNTLSVRVSQIDADVLVIEGQLKNGLNALQNIEYSTQSDSLSY